MFRLSRPASPPLDGSTADSNALDASTCRQQALIRSSDKLARHHPTVKVPPRLQEKPIQEQIRRCCDRFKSHPTTVDTLIRALSTILHNPTERKYRRIDQTNPGYQRSLAKVPGAEPLLLALGFGPVNSTTLYLSRVDRDLLSMALSILEHTTKQTPDYQRAKRDQLFAKEITAQLAAVPSPLEQTKRQHLLSMLPKEPSPFGRSAVITIQFFAGDHPDKNSNNKRTRHRRFDGDDTLQDVLNWLGGTFGTTLVDKLVCSTSTTTTTTTSTSTSREWSLVDVNRQGFVPIDCQRNADKTLQYLGFWPSGRLAVRPSSLEWMEEGGAATTGKSTCTEMGASRGLGSAPSETLQY